MRDRRAARLACRGTYRLAGRVRRRAAATSPCVTDPRSGGAVTGTDFGRNWSETRPDWMRVRGADSKLGVFTPDGLRYGLSG